MFTKTKKLKTPLEIEISTAYNRAVSLEVGTPEYDALLESLSKLIKIQAATAPEKISKDTLALIAANLFGITLIISHEHANVITTKALSFILKAR